MSCADGERRPRRCPGTLIITFGRSTVAQSRCASATVACASLADAGRDLDRDVAVAAVGALVHRLEDVARVAHVGRLDELEQLHRA